MDVYLLVAFIAVLVTAAGAVLIWLDHYLEMKLVKKTGKIICNDVIPTAEEAMEVYTKELFEQTKEMTGNMMKEIGKLV